MEASNPIPHPSRPTLATPGGAGPGSPAGAADDRPEPISEDEAARLIAGAPVAADPFAILSRRGGRPMSDEQIAEFLCNSAQPGAEVPRHELPPLPIARVAAKPAAPAPMLGYANRKDHDGRYSDPRYLAELPVTFRVLRVAPWVLVALFMLYSMLSRIVYR